MTTIDERPDNNDATLRQMLQIVENNRKQLEIMAKTMQRITDVQLSLAQAIEANWTEFEEFRATTAAALEKIDRVLDYLIVEQGKKD